MIETNASFYADRDYNENSSSNNDVFPMLLFTNNESLIQF
jgi:hypothetical protein